MHAHAPTHIRNDRLMHIMHGKCAWIWHVVCHVVCMGCETWCAYMCAWDACTPHDNNTPQNLIQCHIHAYFPCTPHTTCHIHISASVNQIRWNNYINNVLSEPHCIIRVTMILIITMIDPISTLWYVINADFLRATIREHISVSCRNIANIKTTQPPPDGIREASISLLFC